MSVEKDAIDWPPEEYARLTEHRLKATESFDRTLVTLAAGALAISISFVHDLAPHPRHVWLMGIAWSGFCASLLLILASFLTSVGAHDKIIEQMRRRVADLKQPRRLTTALNRAAAGSFALGAVFLVVFAWFNVGHV